MTLPRRIQTVEDVVQFFTHLSVDDSMVWHPNNPMRDYRNLTAAQARRRQKLMDDSKELLDRLGLDIYCLGMLNDAKLEPGFRTQEEMRHLCDGCEREAQIVGVNCREYAGRKDWDPRMSGRKDWDPRAAHANRFVDAYLKAVFETTPGATGEFSQDRFELKTLRKLIEEATFFSMEHGREFKSKRAEAGRAFWMSRNDFGIGFRDASLFGADVASWLHDEARSWMPLPVKLHRGLVTYWPYPTWEWNR